MCFNSDVHDKQLYVSFETHQDFNCSSGDFGGDTQSLEKRGLLRAQPSILGWHSHVTWGYGSSTGSCRHLEHNTTAYKNFLQWLLKFTFKNLGR